LECSSNGEKSSQGSGEIEHAAQRSFGDAQISAIGRKPRCLPSARFDEAQEGLAMSDIGHLTHGILDNATDLVDIWRNNPWRRDEFGQRELEDIEKASKELAGLAGAILIHMNRKKLKAIA
jgi:hypothetical protein